MYSEASRRGMGQMTKLIKGYRIIALIQIFMCICFALEPGGKAHGEMFGAINFIGAGVLFIGSILAYIKQEKWKLWALSVTMIILIFFNTVWFIQRGDFLTGFPLIGYDVLFVVANLHFLGKGL